jgi:hypothetical protein
MQAIITKYLPVTATKPARIKASCSRGSLTISVYSGKMIQEVSGHDELNHICAAGELIKKFVKEDGNDSWARPFKTGQLPNMDYVHVFIK